MIRLVSVIGHGIELLPHFIKHYQDQVDEIQLVVYETEHALNLYENISKIIKDYHNVSIVMHVKYRSFDWDKVTGLYNFVKNTHPNDWWVVADIDEFQVYPYDDLNVLTNECDENNWDIVRGGFIDRIGKNGEMVEIDQKHSIFKQFPLMGFFRYPLSKACPNKICVMKGYVELTSGQHYAKINDQTTWRWMGWNHPLIAPYDIYSVQVHHFKWDSTCKSRLEQIINLNNSYSFTDEYKLMYDKLNENDFKIDIKNPEFMIVKSSGSKKYKTYIHWDKLIKKIVSI